MEYLTRFSAVELRVKGQTSTLKTSLLVGVLARVSAVQIRVESWVSTLKKIFLIAMAVRNCMHSL